MRPVHTVIPSVAFPWPRLALVMSRDPWLYFAWARCITLPYVAEEIALWGEPALRGLQRDKECEIAIRYRVVEA